MHAMMTGTIYGEDTLKAFPNVAVQIRSLDTKQQYTWWCEEFCHRLVRRREDFCHWKVKKKEKEKFGSRGLGFGIEDLG